MLRRVLAAFTVALPVLLSPACAATVPPPVAAPAPAPPPPGPETRFHALLLNGGGSPDINFQPHLLHLRAMREMLLASGLRPDQITVFSSDGDDPAPDFVSRAVQPESDFWLLRDTRLEHVLEMPRVLVSSAIPGAPLQPASKDALKKWFDAEAHTLKPGDTLFLYVTDHGNRNGADPLANTIQLWGNEQLSVKELGDLLRELPVGVRVVSLMSQCFSGGFAALSALATPDASPTTCGYFSSTADRPAYGCFPENVGKERVGHSFHFLRALTSDRHLASAQDEVLAVDDTPDVPLKSSDAFLATVLQKGATEHKTTTEALSAELLGPSWRDQPQWQTERALADRIAGEYGMVSPRSLADVEAQRGELAELQRSFSLSAKSWKDALADAAGDNLDGFVAANPAWKDRLADEALKTLSPEGASALTAALLAELVPWTRKDKGDRLEILRHKYEEADEAAYRTEVRIAVSIRLEILLTSLAGRAYLARLGAPALRDDYAALRACEDIALPGTPLPLAPGAASGEALTVFPSIGDERRLEHEVHPAWIGISFAQVREDLRKDRGLPDGASLVTSVYPTSPAKDGGLAVGDLVIGPPGKPFTARNQVRSWTMLSPVGQPEPLEIMRGSKQLEITLAPRPHPGPLPPPPAAEPLAVGAAAPPVSLRTYRGAAPNLKDGKAHLLLFWATWCGPCKASLPEVLAFEKARHTQVIAITDEPPATLDAFFTHWKTPFPKNVAIDDFKGAFLRYGITATPGYVLIDEKGIVRARGTGYGRPQGLQIDGWKWDGK